MKTNARTTKIKCLSYSCNTCKQFRRTGQSTWLSSCLGYKTEVMVHLEIRNLLVTLSRTSTDIYTLKEELSEVVEFPFVNGCFVIGTTNCWHNNILLRSHNRNRDFDFKGVVRNSEKGKGGGGGVVRESYCPSLSRTRVLFTSYV